MGKKVYAVVRPSLSDAQKSVQAAHALVELVLKNPLLADPGVWGHESLVLLRADSDRQFEDIASRLPSLGTFHASFDEPFYGNQLTAVAFLESGETWALTAGLRLMIKDADASVGAGASAGVGSGVSDWLLSADLDEA